MYLSSLIWAQKENEYSFIVFLFCVAIHVQHYTHTGKQGLVQELVEKSGCYNVQLNSRKLACLSQTFKLHIHQSDEYLKLNMQILIFAMWAVVFPESQQYG